MAVKHKWKIAVLIDGVQKDFKDSDGNSLDHIPFEGTIAEALLNIKKYMLNEIQKRGH